MKNEHILKAAVEVAIRDGFTSMTRDAVAAYANIANGSVNKTYGTMKQLKRAVMRYAVHHQVLSIIAIGLANRDSVAMKAPEHLKRQALESLL